MTLTEDRATPSSEPFAGIRVVDLSTRLSGAFAARLFGDFGADVVLAEPPVGHPLRHEPPFLAGEPGPERSVLHAFLNWNKRSVVTGPTAQLIRLVEEADVVVSTDSSDANGPTSSVFRGMRPGTVHLVITPHGLSSPLAGVRGNDLTISARCGWASINGYRDEPPLKMPGRQVGYIAGVAGFVAAAAALLDPASGSGAELIDVSELEAFSLTVHPWGVAAVYAGAESGFERRPRRGDLGPLYEAADGWLSMAVAYFRNWRRAIEVLGLDDVASDPDLQDDARRHTRDISAVISAVARSVRSLDRWAVFHSLAALRCPVGVLQKVDELVEDPQLAARGFFTATEIDGHVVRAPGPVARIDPPQWRSPTPAPRLDPTPASGAQQAEAGAPSLGSHRRHRGHSDTWSAGSLAGVRVLSFGQAWSGAFATELLALLGADVVQVSSFRHPDSWRRAGAPIPKALVDPNRVQHPLNTQGLYNSVNLNKRDVTLDLERQEGRALLWRLIPNFSVMVDNFRPAVLPAWGVTLEKLHNLHPGMVWASLSGYGSNGPYGEYPAIGTTIETMAGLSSLHGYEGEAGMNTGGLYPDPVAGYFLAATIIAAIWRRGQTGDPQRIDLSMMEAVATVCGDAVMEYAATGEVPRPMGNHHRWVAPHNIYATLGGGWLALAAEDDAAWDALVSYIGDGRLRDPRFTSMASRKEHEAVLDEVLAEWCAIQDAARAEAVLGELGLTAARVVPLADVYRQPDPNLLATGFIEAVEHPEAGTTWLPGRPWRFARQHVGPIVAAPCVGQHSREVLTGELGMSASEYDGLVRAGVTGTLDDLGTHVESTE